MESRIGQYCPRRAHRRWCPPRASSCCFIPVQTFPHLSWVVQNDSLGRSRRKFAARHIECITQMGDFDQRRRVTKLKPFRPIIHYTPAENLEHIDVGLIDGARHEIDVAAYVLTDWPVMQALTRAADSRRHGACPSRRHPVCRERALEGLP